MLCRFDLQYNAKYQKKFEYMTGRVYITFLFDDGDSNAQPERKLSGVVAPQPPPLHTVSSTSNNQQKESYASMSNGFGLNPNKKMIVSILKAESLLAKDRGGTSDPFAELIVGNQMKKTRIIDKTLNPTWNETFEFYAGEREDTLSVVLYDDDKGMLYGSTKEYLGSIELPIHDLLKEGSVEKW